MTKVSAYELITRLTSRVAMNTWINIRLQGGTMSYSEIAAVWHTRFPSGWLPETMCIHGDRHNWQHIVRLGFLVRATLCDVTLQLFFIVTSITGWIHWLKVRVATSCRCAERKPVTFSFVALCCRRGRRLRLFTPHLYNAWAPWLDSLILTFSVLAQLC